MLLREQWDGLRPPALREIFLTLSQLPEAEEVRIGFLRAIGTPGLEDALADPLGEAINLLGEHNVIERPREDHVRLHPLVHAFAAGEADGGFRNWLVGRATARLSNPDFLAGATSSDLIKAAAELLPIGSTWSRTGWLYCGPKALSEGADPQSTPWVRSISAAGSRRSEV